MIVGCSFFSSFTWLAFSGTETSSSSAESVKTLRASSGVMKSLTSANDSAVTTCDLAFFSPTFLVKILTIFINTRKIQPRPDKPMLANPKMPIYIGLPSPKVPK